MCCVDICNNNNNKKYLQFNSCTQGPENILEEEEKRLESQRPRKSHVRLRLLNNTNKHANVEGGKCHWVSLLDKELLATNGA